MSRDAGKEDNPEEERSGKDVEEQMKSIQAAQKEGKYSNV